MLKLENLSGSVLDTRRWFPEQLAQEGPTQKRRKRRGEGCSSNRYGVSAGWDPLVAE